MSPRVSGKVNAAQSTTSVEVKAVKMKIASQPKPVSSRPPVSGASVGTTTMTVATRPSIEAARLLSKRSRMMARLTTRPAEAPTACSTRARIRLCTVEISTALMLASAVIVSATSSTGLLPTRSDSGPISNWPAASASR